jgi:outer membrane translocation and assembly module TamA
MKMRHLLSLLTLILIFACSSTKKQKLCTHLVFEEKGIKLSDSEKKLACGDPSVAEWREIPSPQAEYHLKAFLLERGYFDPKIDFQRDRIVVHPGPRTLMNTYKIHDWPAAIADDEPGEEMFVGRRLSPAQLSEAEKVILQRLKQRGYACAAVSTKAYPQRSHVDFFVKAGAPFRFPEIRTEATEKVELGALERVRAFREGELYDFRLLELSERRIRDSGIVQDIVYLNQCEGRNLEISQKVFEGKARTIVAGVGFDTEQYAIARLRLTFNRLNSSGSSLQTQIFTSFKQQSLQNELKIYPWEASSPQHLFLDVDVAHLDEKQFENILTQASFGWGTGLETSSLIWGWKLGPLLERQWIYRGKGKRNTMGVGLGAEAAFMSHNFEYYKENPIKGLQMSWELKSAHEDLGSTFTALQSKISAQFLALLYQDHKSDLVLGLRSFFGSTFKGNDTEDLRNVPATYRFFLGGSSDIRGFSRQELPRSEEGAFSAFYLGSEARLARIFALEPLAFVDFAALATHELDWQTPYYLSPGFGLRYHSFIGTVRGTVAYGLAIADPHLAERSQHIQFFLSLGEEF